MRRLVLIVAMLPAAVGCGGASSTMPSTPVANFQGMWSGPWVRQACSETGSAVGFCGLFTGGTMVLGFSQNGSAVQGTLDGLGNRLTVSGSIGTTGTLTLTGQGTSPAGGALTLTGWQSQVSGNSMTGSFTWVVLNGPSMPAGAATVTSTFDHVPRVG